MDTEKVEMPRAPGGMTGGVEHEAVQYMVCITLLYFSFLFFSNFFFFLGLDDSFG